MSCHGMSISFNVLCYLLNMQRGRGRGVYKRSWTLNLSFWLQSTMHTLGALRLACYQLLLLGVFGKQSNHGTRNMSFRTERSHRHHLPTYMMHLYRHFKLNQTRPVENTEHEQADTIKSILSKSKICFPIDVYRGLEGRFYFHESLGSSRAPRWKSLKCRGSFVAGPGGSWLSNLSARHLQSTSHLWLNKSRTNALRKADVD